MREKIEKIIIFTVFGFYFALLLKMLFFSRSGEVSALNLVPFKSIYDFLSGHSEFAFGNVVGNILLFAPLGFFLPFLRRDKKIGINMLMVFAFSLLAEVIQYFLAIGIADVDDVILNCIGGLSGILLCKLLDLVSRNDKRLQTATAVLSLLGLPVILYLLFVIKMRF